MKFPFLLLVTSSFTISTFSQEISPQIEWQKALGGTNGDRPYSIQQTKDSGYIIAGNSNSNDGDVSGNHGYDDYWVVKLNSTGAMVWQKALGGTSGDFASCIQQTTDDGYIVAGNTDSTDGDVSGNHGGRDSWVVKLNSNGEIVWQKALGGSNNDSVNSIQQTTDGGYIVAGFTDSIDGDISGNHGGEDYWVVKLNSSGAIVWQKTLGGINNDYAYSIQQTTDDGYIVAGITQSNDGNVSGYHGGEDYWIVKLNSTGDIVWQKALGGTNTDHASIVQQTTDGGYIVAGETASNNGDVSGNHGTFDYWVVKLNSTGAIVWQKTLGGKTYDSATGIQQTTDRGYIVTGLTESNNGDVSGCHGADDYWVVKLNSSGDLVWQKALGGMNFEIAWDIQQTIDGGYIVAGFSQSNDGDASGNHGNEDYWVVKLAPENLSISEFENIANNIIYPNPSNNTITIQNKEYLTDNFKYKIIDLTGRMVENGDSNFNEEINIESLRSGNYIIQIQTENGQIINEKLIKN